jgi:DNA-binding PadR family transcriptional regulator
MGIYEGERPSERQIKREIARMLEDFEREGLIRRTGEFHNGQPVYTVTEFGRAQGLGPQSH